MKTKLSSIIIFFLFFTFQIFSQWKAVTLPASDNVLALAMDVADKNTCLLAFNGSQKPGLFLSKDGGKSFVTFSNFLNTSESITDVSIMDTLNFWVVTGHGRIFYTSDCGKNWKTQFYDAAQTDFFNYIEMFDSKNGIAMGDSKNSTSKTLMLRTSNGGNSWVNMNETLIGMSSGDMWRRIDFVSPEVGFFYESGINPQMTYKTIDGGKSWNLVDATSGIMALKFFNENIGAIMYNTFFPSVLYLSVTTDGGKTWPTKTAISNYWGSDIEFIPNNPARILAANMNFVYSSIDTGKTWQKVIMPQMMNIRDIEFADENVGWILGDYGQLYKTENAGYLTTDIELEKPIPNEFILHQNYPNPFNPETTISYQLSAVSQVSLKVYDMLGREVVELVNEFKQPGVYNSQFSLQNSQLPSGVYFYTLKAGSFVSTKKMLLIK